MSCKNALGIEAAWCVGLHEDALRQLLARYKFSSARDASRICVDLLDGAVPVLPDSIVVVPVPTAAAHVRVRGFDHTAAITTSFAKRRGLQHAKPLERRGETTQHFKTRTERLASASKGLEVSGAVPDTVLLIDDIYTTGATMKACVSLLKAGGAREIFLAIIARQPIDETNDLW